MEEADPIGALAAREIVTTRVVGAARARVFQAFADPDHVVRWWGPKGFTNTFHEFDQRPGGTWRFVMHGPDGASYPNRSVFVDVVKPERIVLDHVSGPQFRLTIALAEQTARPGSPGACSSSLPPNATGSRWPDAHATRPFHR